MLGDTQDVLAELEAGKVDRWFGILSLNHMHTVLTPNKDPSPLMLMCEYLLWRGKWLSSHSATCEIWDWVSFMLGCCPWI